MLKRPGASSDSLPCTILSPSTETLPSSAGTTPRSIAGWLLLPESRASFDVGAAPAMRFVLHRHVHRVPPILQRLAIAADRGMRRHLQHVVADLALETAHHRQRGDQRGHPSAMPRMEASEMKEMKPLRRFARR